MSHPTWLTLFALAVLILGGFVGGGHLPKPFRNRSCQGSSWRSAFPSASKYQIREFLSLFVCAFAFNESERLKLKPSDSMLAIYRAVYSRPWQQADALEFETLSEDFEKRYRVKVEDIWRNDLTLGELFSYALAARAA